MYPRQGTLYDLPPPASQKSPTHTMYKDKQLEQKLNF